MVVKEYANRSVSVKSGGGSAAIRTVTPGTPTRSSSPWTARSSPPRTARSSSPRTGLRSTRCSTATLLRLRGPRRSTNCMVPRTRP